MVTEHPIQPELWDEIDATAPTDEPRARTQLPDRPIDPICGKPVIWQPRAHSWGTYCGHNQCVSETRICKLASCRQEFRRAEGGVKFCCPEHRDIWHRAPRQSDRLIFSCPIDAKEHRMTNRWHLCSDCYQGILPAVRTLERHDVPLELVIHLLKDGTCMNPACSTDLYAPVWKGKHQTIALCVDHDHNHHPGAHGCRLCSRWLLCNACNVMIGHAGDSSTVLRGAADLLDEWGSR